MKISPNSVNMRPNKYLIIPALIRIKLSTLVLFFLLLLKKKEKKKRKTKRKKKINALNNQKY